MTKRSDDRRAELVRIAFELQASAEADRERATEAASLTEAAVETGLDPRFLPEAERELARREQQGAELARRRSRNRRLAVMAAGGALAIGGAGVALAPVVFPPPLPPWVETFDEPGRWSLDRNEASRGTLVFPDEPGRGKAAVLRVEAFTPAEDGKHRMNLDSTHVPADASRYSAVAVDLKGSLPSARLFLEGGTDERWRSPAVNVQRDWTTHRLPLRAFERQERRGTEWRVVGWKAPTGLTGLSVKVGHFVNEAETTGELFVDNLRFEAR